jgi:hypothetical protein
MLRPVPGVCESPGRLQMSKPPGGCRTAAGVGPLGDPASGSTRRPGGRGRRDRKQLWRSAARVPLNPPQAPRWARVATAWSRGVRRGTPASRAKRSRPEREGAAQDRRSRRPARRLGTKGGGSPGWRRAPRARRRAPSGDTLSAPGRTTDARPTEGTEHGRALRQGWVEADVLV